VVHRLLEDPRVDPNAGYNEASRAGNLAVLKRLSDDPRIAKKVNDLSK